MAKSNKRKRRQRNLKARTKQSQQKVTSHSQSQSIASRIIERVLSLPRIGRILLAGVFSLALTLVIGMGFYLVDVRFLIAVDGEVTFRLVLPVIVAAVLGLMMYVAGWWFIVGTRAEKMTVRNGILWYLGIGFLALILSVISIMQVIVVL